MATEAGIGSNAPRALKRAVAQELVDVRKRNQVTLPESIATALGVGPADRILFLINENEPGEVHLYRMPKSFAGMAPEAYGGPDSSAANIRAERDAWEE